SGKLKAVVERLKRMRLTLIGGIGIVALILTQRATAQDAGRPDQPAPAPTSTTSPTAPQSPSTAIEGQESLDRIRKALESHPLRGVQLPEADFRVEIRERMRIEDLLSTLDFKAGPVPPGGLYGYEQQRVMFNKVDQPLMQPYAAFSSGELITIALENLIR